MTSWLQRQRKQTLLDLSSEAGLAHEEDSLKDEIVEALDEHLQRHATRLSRNAVFEPYYGARSRTPHKTRSSSGAMAATSDDGDVRTIVRGRGRRATKVKQEHDHDTEAYSPAHVFPTRIAVAADAVLPRRTPGRPRRSELPPSPSDVATLAEYESMRVYAGLNDLISVSGVPETIDYVRELCSSVTGVQLTFLLVEAIALQRVLLPWNWIMDLSFPPAIGLPVVALYFPDLFALLTLEYWLPTLLWSTTSFFVPLLFGYFYNITVHEVRRHGASVSVARYTIDPLTFNVVKALVTYVVYRGPGAAVLGYDHPLATERVRDAMPLGQQGILIGCYVTMLVAVYEAVQGRR